MKKLRLLFTTDCSRSCEGCCNKQFNLSNLPIFYKEDITQYDEVYITGGEPLLHSSELYWLCKDLKEINPNIKIIIYTAYTKYWGFSNRLLIALVDGFTITLNDQKACDEYEKTEPQLLQFNNRFLTKSIRLNIFEGIAYPKRWKDEYQVKDNIVWLKDCPLPEDEIFMQLKEKLL